MVKSIPISLQTVCTLSHMYCKSLWEWEINNMTGFWRHSVSYHTQRDGGVISLCLMFSVVVISPNLCCLSFTYTHPIISNQMGHSWWVFCWVLDMNCISHIWTTIWCILCEMYRYFGLLCAFQVSEECCAWSRKGKGFKMASYRAR